MRTNTPDNYIIGIYRESNRKKSAMVNNLETAIGLNVTRAYGGYYLNIHDIFQDSDNGLRNEFSNYGGLNFLGNIDGKTERQLYFKSKLFMDAINAFRLSMDNLNNDVRDAINKVVSDHGQPVVQVGVLAQIARR